VLRVIFFLIRLPLFLLGLLVYATWGTAVSLALWMFWLCLLAFWILPCEFLSHALAGTPELFRRLFTESFKEWCSAPKRYFRGYRHLYDFLVRGWAP